MKIDIFNTGNKYKVIYADPPWHYNFGKTSRGYVGKKYPLMKVNELASLPIRELSDEDAVLLMWATYPNLLAAISTINAWGFTYKTTAFTWIKHNKRTPSLFWGNGYYTRSNAEVCLLATKGKVLPRMSHKVHSVVISPIEEHSRKPEEVRNRIVELFGDLPRIELFARRQVDGWDCWGNEV